MFGCCASVGAPFGGVVLLVNTRTRPPFSWLLETEAEMIRVRDALPSPMGIQSFFWSLNGPTYPAWSFDLPHTGGEIVSPINSSGWDTSGDVGFSYHWGYLAPPATAIRVARIEFYGDNIPNERICVGWRNGINDFCENRNGPTTISSPAVVPLWPAGDYVFDDPYAGSGGIPTRMAILRATANRFGWFSCCNFAP